MSAPQHRQHRQHRLACLLSSPTSDMSTVDAEHFAKARPPNVLLTTCYRPTMAMKNFLTDILTVFPNATYYKRQVGL